MVSGAQCVMITGISLMVLWSADSLDTTEVFVIVQRYMNTVAVTSYITTAIEVVGEAVFGMGTGPILLDEVTCSGEESQLFECGSNGIGEHDCSHTEDAGVRYTGTWKSTLVKHTLCNMYAFCSEQEIYYLTD